ncbi:SCO family protein [Flavobacterium oreochromis]|uniref:SCO family protein n=1 Tax=Flavobacterium columnare TaxID=996 RepID=A0A246G7R8_9FLAO|nr:SCO family protein [Flavobacterium oreochromis]OWP74630.1 SCO family protein [Flavobacterium oreochromis]POR26999.1 SCO family protein [Flavobacterium columnare]QYS86949.1 SCO family protein [Flavobacterium oreochromis]
MKNRSYIGVSFIVLVFGIIFIPKIIKRIKEGEIVKGDRLSTLVDQGAGKSDLFTVGRAPKFSLTNQEGKIITNNTYKGKVFVLEFFFTTCPTICPIMNRNMKIVQDSFASNANFGIASITINPDTDTQKVLKDHSESLNLKGMNWHFLTGNQEKIYDLAQKGFNLYVGKNKKVSGGFEHSGMFALIDKEGNIRCRKDNYGNPIVYYDGLKPEGIKQIKQDISKLLAE